MIGLVSSILPSSTGLFPAGSGSTSSPVAGFGPDFLLGVIAGRAIPAGAAYDANGRLIVVDDTNSLAAKARKESLEEAKQLLKAGDTVGARAAANRVLKRDPGDAIAAAYVGRTYLLEGDYKSAEKYFVRAASGSDLEQIQTDLRAAQTLAKGESATISEIRRLLRQGPTARDGAQLAAYFLDRHPENLDARLELVGFFERLGRVSLAGAELADALSHVPGDHMERLVQAIEKFNRAHPGDAAAYDLSAQAYVRVGRWTDAQAAFEKALTLAEGNAEFQVQLKEDFAETYFAAAREQKARGNEDEARRLYLAGLDIFSTEAGKGELSDMELERGWRELRAGRIRLALEALENARAYLPGTASEEETDDLIAAFESLAIRSSDAGDLKTAVSARNGAYLLDPENGTRKRGLADAYDVYGLALMADGDYFMAARQFRAALALYTSDANYAAHLADAESRL